MDFSTLGKNLLALEKNAVTFICSLDKSNYNEESDESTRDKIKSFISKSKKEKSEFVKLISKFYSLSDEENKKLKKVMVTDGDSTETAKLLLQKKFDFEFENEQLVESLETPKDYTLDISSFQVYAIADGNIIRYFIFGVQATNKQTGFQSDAPIYGNVYRYHLIKLYKDKNYLEVKGGKYGYKKITNQIKRDNSHVSVTYNIEQSVLDKNFFTNLLKSINFRVLGLNYGSMRDLALNIYSSKKDIGTVSNSFLIFSDEIDLLNFNELQLEYNDSKNGVIQCELKLERNYPAGYYELKLFTVSDTKQSQLIKQKIQEQFNVQIDKKYSLYQGYYLMKLFNSSNRSYWWGHIKESALDFEKTISNLTTLGLIVEHTKSTRLDLKGLANYLYSALDKIKVYRRDDFAIEEVFIENDNIVRFHGYRTERNTNNKKLFSFAISFTDDINNSIPHTCIDWYKVLTTNLDNETEKQALLAYFCNKVHFQNLIESSFFNNKSIESYRLLSDVKNSLHTYTDATLRGKIFESAINDLLLGIYPHYLPLGRDEHPDGLLYFKESKTLFVIDSKSKKKLDSADVDEMIRYLKKGYFNKEIIPCDAKIGVYIFDSQLSESINLQTVKKRTSKEKESISYLSADFLTEYFYFLRENIAELLLSPNLLESCSNEIIKLIKKNSSESLTEKNKSADVITQVLDNEKKCMSELKKCITQCIPITNGIEAYERN